MDGDECVNGSASPAAAEEDRATRRARGEALVRRLYREGHSRSGVVSELTKRGFSSGEGEWLVDGFGLPPPGQVTGDDATAGKPRGIDGWLVLPTLWLIVHPFLLLRAALQSLELLQSEALPWVEAELPGLTRGLQLEFAANLVLLVMVLFVAVAFFRRHRWTRGLMITYLSLQVVLSLGVQIYLVGLVGVDPVVVEISSLVVAAIWIPYFAVSERVKNTFVRGAPRGRGTGA